MPRRQEGSKEAPGRSDGGRILTATRDGEGTRFSPRDPVIHRTGGPTCTLGEALLSPSSRPTYGVCRKIGRRGSLVG